MMILYSYMWHEQTVKALSLSSFGICSSSLVSEPDPSREGSGSETSSSHDCTADSGLLATRAFKPLCVGQPIRLLARACNF